MLKIFDIGGCADIALARIPLAVDNTFAPPLWQLPLQSRGDARIHSTQKKTS